MLVSYVQSDFSDLGSVWRHGARFSRKLIFAGQARLALARDPPPSEDGNGETAKSPTHKICRAAVHPKDSPVYRFRWNRHHCDLGHSGRRSTVVG
jgi:hypothetical protein